MLPEACGRGYGTEAHRLLARYLFAHATAHPIEAATELNNLRSGAWRDGVIYSLLRTDPLI
jgi:RimJ/RimL family protein N-acetyltransferase